MSALFADRAWFTIAIEGGPDFEVYAFEGREKLNEPFEFTVEVVSRDANIDLVDIICRKALLTVADHSGGKRKINGTIREAQQLHTANLFTHYQLIIVPRLWYLGQNQDHRIFQNMSVIEIFEQIFKRQGFPFEMVAYKLKEKYQPREYCVQYAESDLYFISRLCEEEGIYYYFEHTDDYHTLCFSDAYGGPNIPESDGGLLRFFPGSGQVAETAVITHLNVKHTVNSDRATYREWNFEQPPLNLEAASHEESQAKAPAPGGMKLETYQFPHLYNLSTPGHKYSDIQLKRQISFARWVEGEGNVSRLLPGFAFTVESHPRRDVNAQWWLTEVHHKGEQPQVLEHESPDRGFFYKSEFVAIPFETRFVPPIVHPKKRIEGLQSAIVTGPGSEEVYVDKYGRVKVHFHWDRLGPMTDRSTCWVRVADAWAGQNFGFIQPPRVGQEVIVEFMEGDPDRPVITGRVYNAEKMPPWELPQQKMLSGIQSKEFFGGQRNQIVFDDTKGRVQTQVSTDHQLSQLNLGYITRINHFKGRDDFRGEGFELRTDGWGVTRASKGLFLTTYGRQRGEKHQKDVLEATQKLQSALEQQENQGKYAVEHKAQEEGDDLRKMIESLQAQLDEIRGAGKAHGEFTKPQMLLASPSGCAIAAEELLQLQAGKNAALVAGGHASFTAGKSFLATALEKISLFAHSLGLKFFAAAGKVEIQAQSDAVEIIADQVLKLISSKKSIELAAAEEIKLSCGGSYIKINEGGIEQGTGGEWKVHAANHKMVGPKTAPVELPNFNAPGKNWMDLLLLDDDLQPIPNIPYKVTFMDGSVIEGVLDGAGSAKLKDIPPGSGEVEYFFPGPEDKKREGLETFMANVFELVGVI